jgi:hypothetical protein
VVVTSADLSESARALAAALSTLHKYFSKSIIGEHVDHRHLAYVAPVNGLQAVMRWMIETLEYAIWNCIGYLDNSMRILPKERCYEMPV